MEDNMNRVCRGLLIVLNYLLSKGIESIKKEKEIILEIKKLYYSNTKEPGDNRPRIIF